MCDVVDAGTEWRFVDGQPSPDFEPFCSSKCIDFPGTLTLDGQHDLRKVPLLAKLRKVDRLIINVAGLPDLRGLEKIDVGTLLNIVNTREGAPDTTFSSTMGLEDDAIESISIVDVPGLKSLKTSLRRVNTLSIESTGISEIDLNSTATANLRIIKNTDLRSIELGSGNLESLLIGWNESLDTLAWTNLRVRASVRITGNPKLSNCRAQELAGGAGAPLVTVIDNGPCP